MIKIDYSKIDPLMDKATVEKLTPEERAFESQEFEKWLESEEGREAVEMIEAQYRTYQNLDKSAKT